MRSVCVRCRRPESVCYCSVVTPLATRTRVVILQHPRERDVPINTARIASLCLPDAELHVGVQFDRAWGSDAALLYPGDDAIDVEAHPPPGPITLVVVDGTWWQARKLVRANPALAKLPRYAFRPKQPSDYRIRREPQDDYVSTIEALVHVLGVLEGDGARFEAMLLPFRRMVDLQLEHAARGQGRPRRVMRPRPPRARPRMQLPRELVCVYAEANAWPFGTEERASGADELVQWVACRVATGETFEAFVRPRGPLAPSTSFHTEVAEKRFLGGITREELLARWQAFARPNDVVASWGHYTPRLFDRAGGALLGRSLDLRRAAHLFTNARLGTMDTYAASTLRAPVVPLAQGRAGRRLAQMVAIAKSMIATPPELDEGVPIEQVAE